MARKKGDEGTGELRPVAPTATRSAVAEFAAKDGTRWRVARFDLLAAEFGMGERALPDFLEAMTARPTRAWLVTRRLFGVGPAVPAATSDLDDFRMWGREELQEALGLTRGQLQEEMGSARGIWLAAQGRKEESAPAEAPPTGPAGELVFREEELLARHNFPEKTFQVAGRAAEENRRERDRFAARLGEWRKILEHPACASLARQALLTELQLWRLEAEMLSMRPGAEGYAGLSKLNVTLQAEYREQVEQIDNKVPWLGAIAGKLAFKGVVTELTEGIRRYKAGKGTELIDGIFTATEVQVMLRRSVQAPEPMYRAGLSVFLAASRAGFWDPNWRGQFSARQLKAIDAGWKGAMAGEQAAEEGGEKLTDLEADGPAGEYEELKMPE